MEHISHYLGENRFKDAGKNGHAAPVIRKMESGGWYWISRVVLLSHGRALKPSGIAVYNVLASFANSKTQSCFPTHRTIAKIAGTSKRTVSEKIRLLEKLELIHRERQEGQSIYHLLAIGQVEKESPDVQ